MLVGLQSRLLHGRCEWHPEAALQIADEAFDLAFGLGHVRPTQPWQEPGVACVVEEAWMEPMHVPTIGVASRTTVLTLSLSTSRGTPLKAPNAFSWQPISVSSRSYHRT